MFKSLFENALYMAVGEGVIDNFPPFCVLYEVGKTQRLQLVRNRRFGHPQQNRQIADAHGVAGERPQDFDAGIVRKHLVEVRQGVKISGSRHSGAHLADDILMDNVAIARKLAFFLHGIPLWLNGCSTVINIHLGEWFVKGEKKEF